MSEILIVNGSVRRNSNSRLLSSMVAEGAGEKDNVVEIVEIGGLDIKPCRGCEACLADGAKGCVVNDDMRALYPKVKSADVLVLVSPIYWFTLCGQTKQFLDRCFAVAAVPDPDGKSPFARKKLGAVLVYGDVDPFKSGCVNAIRTLQDIAAYTGAVWAGALYGSAYAEGEIAENAELMEQAREYGRNM